MVTYDRIFYICRVVRCGISFFIYLLICGAVTLLQGVYYFIMSVCCFFGHKDCSDNVEESLRTTIIDLLQQGVATFYVGNHGKFDYKVKYLLRELSQSYEFTYAVVLTAPPTTKTTDETEDYSDSIVPEEIENCPPKYRIDKRNRWMEKQADVVVCYITHTIGGAYQYVKLAKSHKKKIINIAK